MSVLMMTPQEMAIHVAQVVQAKRLSLNLSQKSLSERAGVSFGVLKKFERTGKISLESLLRLAFALGALEGFAQLFTLPAPERFTSLDALLAEKTRKRGRG